MRVRLLVRLLVVVVLAGHVHPIIHACTGRSRDGIRRRLVELTHLARLAHMAHLAELRLSSRATFVGRPPSGRRVDIALGINPLCPDENLAIPEAVLPRDRTFVACRPRAVAAQASTTAVVARLAVAWRHAPNAARAVGVLGMEDGAMKQKRADATGPSWSWSWRESLLGVGAGGGVCDLF